MPTRRVFLTSAFVFFMMHGPAFPQNYIPVPSTDSPVTLAARDTENRRTVIRGIHTRFEAESRQEHVREAMLRLLGPLPEKSPLNERILGETILPGFRIQKILFDSQPGFHVTALLYLPSTTLLPPYPAIVMAPDHSLEGKASDFAFASAFVRNGFAVLSYDPIGQGERLQYPDPTDPTRSLVWNVFGEHGEAGLRPVLIGESVAKYFLWDGIRAVDYLESRGEIDHNRIGAFGCGGGGALTALLGALDSRIAAVGTACYITSFDALLRDVGPLEQLIPNWLTAGLDFPDWVEMAAPRPYAIIATKSGTNATEKEARDFYKLFDADRNLVYITAPGLSDDLRPILPRILKFFIDSLHSNPFAPVYNDQSKEMQPLRDALRVTSTGQVSTSYVDSETVFSLNLQETKKVSSSRPDDLSQLQRAIREVTAATVRPAPVRSHVMPKTVDSANGEPVWCGVQSDKPYLSAGFSVEALGSQTNEGAAYTTWQLSLRRPWGLPLTFTLAIPHRAGECSLALMLPGPEDTAVTAAQSRSVPSELARLVSSGHIVLVLSPRPDFSGLQDRALSMLGNYYFSTVRAELVGKTLVGLRIDDTIEATNYLENLLLPHRPDVLGEASGHMALVLMHVAVLDPRLTQVAVTQLPRSYAELVADPHPWRASEDILPGVLLRYDVPDLIRALGPRLSVFEG